MELKDVILSTLAEIEDITSQSSPFPMQESPEILDVSVTQENILSEGAAHCVSERTSSKTDEEIRMLEGIRERLLVLFEGFQSPNNVNIEAKVDLTLNFLEYLLATIENRLDTVR
ncbi:MAG TPA: hypothetical protein VFX57_03330 [Sulfuricurvum sp.]|nr:hypothetical protein [Sulfuricurvum sp.]